MTFSQNHLSKTILPDAPIEEYDLGEIEEAHLYALAETLDTNLQFHETKVHDRRPSGLGTLDVAEVPARDANSSLPYYSLGDVTEGEYDGEHLSRTDILEVETKRKDLGASPLSRFRGNRISVTDLVSPAWCEVQFEYTLETHGRKRRTAAMSRGNEIHANLEKQIHRPVRIELDVDIPEERLALRLLTTMQGLKELRSTGLTRELPILGILQGILVTGVIDDLTLVKDDQPASANIQEFFLKKSTQPDRYLIMLGDVKTRVSRTEPSEQQYSQARLQLMLYRCLLENTSNLAIEDVASLNGLDVERRLSDAFITQVIDMLGSDLSDLEVDQLIAQSTIKGYWGLLLPELKALTSKMAPFMEVHYIHQETSETIAKKRFMFDHEWMSSQIATILKWWNGQRAAQGVSITDAYKCKYCAFADGCSWRLEQVQAAIDRKRSQKRRTNPLDPQC